MAAILFRMLIGLSQHNNYSRVVLFILSEAQCSVAIANLNIYLIRNSVFETKDIRCLSHEGGPWGVCCEVFGPCVFVHQTFARWPSKNYLDSKVHGANFLVRRENR